jgi:PST family polysaccharide transporter
MTVFAPDVFRILLGPQWLPAAPIFQWLGVCGLHQVITSTTGWLFLSQGRGGDFFKLGLFNAVATVISFVIGLPWGPLGVAISYTICNYLVLVPATWWSAGRRGQVSTRDILSAAFPHALATVLSGTILIGLAPAMHPLGVLTCIGLASVSYAAYGAAILAFPAKRRMLNKNLQAFLGEVLFKRKLN